MDGVIVSVRVTPRAGQDGIDGPDGQGILRIRVRAAPADGAANEAVVRLLAASLDVPRSAVTIVSGATGRRKRLRIDGADAASLRSRWPGLTMDQRAAG